MKFGKLILAMGTVLLMASCGTDDPAKEHYTAVFTDHFAHTSALNTASGSVGESFANVGDVNLDFDDDSHRATIFIESLKVGDEMMSNLLFKDIPLDTDSEGVRRVKAADLTKYGAIYPLQSLELDYWPDLRVEGTTYHAMYLRLKMANGRIITVLPYESTGISATEITTIDSGSKYVSTKNFFNVSFDRTTYQPTIFVENPDFDPKMPPLATMKFAGDSIMPIEIKYTDTGYTLKCQKLVPEINGRPFESFAITLLDCEAKLLGNELDVKFYCGGKYAVEAVAGALYVEKKR